jgi:hypothetical protein
MAYKSNKQARAEYLANESKNREANRRRNERKQGPSSDGGRSGNLGKAIFLVLLVFLFIQYINHRSTSTPVQKGVLVAAPSRH